MSHSNRPTEANMASSSDTVRVAFKDVSNRSERERSKHAKPVKAHKRNVATIYSSLPTSNLSSNKRNGVAAKSVEDENIPLISQSPCDSKKAGATMKRASVCDSSKSYPSKPNKPAIPTLASGTSAAYQDGPAHDIDKRDSDDPQSVTAYVQDMFKYYKDEEDRSVVGNYMDGQPTINARMRSILVDWLCTVHYKSKCDPETIFLTVNIIDRYLSKVKTATKKNLQLIGICSLLIASKYEQIYPVEIKDLVFLCDYIYTKEEIVEMETTILKTLHYQISIPTLYKFFLRFLNAGHADRKLVFLTSYLLEESLLSYDIITTFKPSQLAAAAILIGRHAVGRNKWSPTLLKYSDYREEDLIPVARAMLAAKRSLSPELDSLKKKYSRSNKLKAASIELRSDI